MTWLSSPSVFCWWCQFHLMTIIFLRYGFPYVSSAWIQRFSDDYCGEWMVKRSQRETNSLLYWPYRIPECQSLEGLLRSLCPAFSCLRYRIRAKDVKRLGQSPTASEWQSWDWNPRWQTLVSLLCIFLCLFCSCQRAPSHVLVPIAKRSNICLPFLLVSLITGSYL